MQQCLPKEQPSTLDPLLDSFTKGKAMRAPHTVFLLVVIVVLIYLASG